MNQHLSHTKIHTKLKPQHIKIIQSQNNQNHHISLLFSPEHLPFDPYSGTAPL